MPSGEKAAAPQQGQEAAAAAAVHDSAAILQHFPPVEYAMMYGSSAFRQAGYPAKASPTLPRHTLPRATTSEVAVLPSRLEIHPPAAVRALPGRV